jgi:hypothetical protein
VALRPRGLLAAALLTAIAAWAGVVGLATGALDLTRPVEQRLPFHSPVFAAAALAVVVAAPCSIAATSAWRRDARVGVVTECAGWLLVDWIVVEVCVIRSFSALQPLCAGLGVLLIALGRHAKRTA